MTIQKARAAGLLTALLLFSAGAWANQPYNGSCRQGGNVVTTSGLNSTTKVNQSFPSCSVEVFLAGTSSKATLYADNMSPPTPLGNPFTANTDGSFKFYASNGRYDVQLSGGGIVSPFLVASDLVLFDFGSPTVSAFTVAFSSTPAFNVSLYSLFLMTLTGNVTSSTITGTAASGQLAGFRLCQDSVGGHSFAFPASFLSPPHLILRAGACTDLSFVFDGVNWDPTAATGAGLSVPGNAIFSGPSPHYDIEAYGAVPNGELVEDGVTTSGSNVLTSASGLFAPGDVGKPIMVTSAGTAVSTPSAPSLSAAAVSGNFFGTAITAGTTGWAVTYIKEETTSGALEETLPSAISYITTTTSPSVILTSPVASPGAVAYRVWGCSGVACSTLFLQSGAPIGIGDTYQQNGTLLASGTSPPVSSTAFENLYTSISSYSSPTTVTLAVAASTSGTAEGVIWGTNNAAAIQAAVNAAAATGGIVYASGRYAVGSTINVTTGNIVFACDGAGAVSATATGQYLSLFNGDLFKSSMGSIPPAGIHQTVTVRGCSFQGNPGELSTAWRLTNGSVGSAFINSTFRGFGDGALVWDNTNSLWSERAYVKRCDFTGGPWTMVGQVDGGTNSLAYSDIDSAWIAGGGLYLRNGISCYGCDIKIMGNVGSALAAVKVADGGSLVESRLTLLSEGAGSYAIDNDGQILLYNSTVRDDGGFLHNQGYLVYPLLGAHNTLTDSSLGQFQRASGSVTRVLGTDESTVSSIPVVTADVALGLQGNNSLSTGNAVFSFGGLSSRDGLNICQGINFDTCTVVSQLLANGNAVFNGTLQYGGGSVMNEYLFFSSVSITPTAVAATSCAQETFTPAALAALTTSFNVSVNFLTPSSNLAFPVSWQSASGGVAITYCNPTSGSLTPVATSISVAAWK